MSDGPGAAPAQTYFLSYSRADERVAMRFATDLRARGIAMWVDQLDIRPSEHWDRAIERAVRDCRGLVVILSPRSVASDNVADEISYAIDSGKSVLPVMIERCTLPLRITRMQVVDGTRDYGRALQQCVEAIGGGDLARNSAPRFSPGISDAALIERVKEQLTPFVGPIAAILVDKAAARAESTAEFYDVLAERIESEDDRRRFLALAGKRQPAPERPQRSTAESKSPVIAPAEVDRLASVFTAYVGPIASVIVRRESTAAASAEELQQRLASRIGDDAERADFLRRSATR